MTWVKLSDSFGDDCARSRLSDAAFRTHVEGLVWTMRRETAGQLDHVDIRKAIETSDPDAAIAELVATGYWETDGTGYVIRHHMEHQPEPDLIAKRRARDAERQRRARRQKAGLTDGE